MGRWKISVPGNRWSAIVSDTFGWRAHLMAVDDGRPDTETRVVLLPTAAEAAAADTEIWLTQRALAEVIRRGGNPDGYERLTLTYTPRRDAKRYGQLEQRRDLPAAPLYWRGQVQRREDTMQASVVRSQDFGGELATGMRWLREDLGV